MKCKDCRKRRKCISCLKSYRYSNDGDSWANWCDDFDSVHKTRTLYKDGYLVMQSGVDWHIVIIDDYTNEMVLHEQCTKKMSNKKLLKMIDHYRKGIYNQKRMEFHIKLQNIGRKGEQRQ